MNNEYNPKTKMLRYKKFRSEMDITIQVMELAELAKQGVRIQIKDIKRNGQ